MKLRIGRGSAVLEAPEESYAFDEPAPTAEYRGLATTVSPEVGVREPAPAGALQRSAAGAFTDSATHDEEYVPRRSANPSRFRLKMAVPSSMAGRIVAGSMLLVLLAAVVLTVAGTRRYLLHDDRFAVATSSEIEIQGAEHLTRAQVLSVFGSDLERDIFKVPLGERRSDLERLPWVAHATVMRLLPNHLRILITERIPVAFVRQGTELGLVDASGVLLDMPEQTAGHYSFPVLTGLAPADPLSARAARMAVYLKFIKELDGGPQKLSGNLSEVDVSNPEDVKALVANGGADVLVHFGDEKFLERYQLFEQHLPDWRTQYPKLASADMRYEQQVVLEMAAGSSVPLNDGAGAPAPTTDAAPAATLPLPPAPAPVARPQEHAVVPHPAARPTSHKLLAPVKAKPAARDAAHAALEAKIAQARAARVANTVAGGAR